MKVKELIAELEIRNPESRVFVLDDEGDKARVHKLYRIEDDRPKHQQDVLIMHKI
ncbi:hypothetical protein [Siminovitchia sp. 179-K 8D1 HS]|uniref:hypothetical protein n=1 Tax=Siminovitchia sp. 179-K 8D1 HS TaxID=3142385 RepID=UPI0039A022FD